MQFIIESTEREELIDITHKVQEQIRKSKIKEGICLVYVPHATAALTINENIDPELKKDILHFLAKEIPQGRWLHDEEDDNADAHIKSAIIGPSVTIPIQNSELALGKWQGIILCEFDGPRERKVLINCVGK